MMQPIETEELIELVGARPVLYNKKLKSYLNVNQKKKMWLEICQALFPEWSHLSSGERACLAERVQKRWQNIRSCFKREYNVQTKLLAEPAPKRRKIYEYYDSLHFLIPQMDDYDGEEEEPESDKEVEEEGKEEASDEVQEESGDDNEKVFLETHLSDSEHNETVNVKVEAVEKEERNVLITPKLPEDLYDYKTLKKSFRGKRAQKNEAVYVDNEYQPEPTSTRMDVVKRLASDPLDEDTHFLLSLVPSFQRMTYSQKLKVKMKFLHVLRDMAEKLEF